MSRLRLLLLVAGAGTLLAGMPAHGAARSSTEPSPSSSTEPSPSSPTVGGTGALQLLSAASRAARSRSYSGTQYVSTWHEDTATSSVADLHHTPAGGTAVSVRPTSGAETGSTVSPTTDLDPRLLTLLAEHYVLTVGPAASCTGRSANVVEARHPSDGGLAGRFWIDSDSSLVLRRETFDGSGRLVHSSAFTSLDVGPGVGTMPDVTTDALDPAAVDTLRRQGWQVPAALGEDLELYDARMRTHEGQSVLHLSYSDGLSTLSLFAQRGRLGATRMAGFTKQKLGRGAVWVRPSSPERVVWGGGGRVFTLLSDAPAETVRAAVTGLPHDKAPRTGPLARLGRGLARLASWLNPFS